MISISEEIPTWIENNDSEIGNGQVESDPILAAEIESEHGETHEQPPKPRSVHPLTMSEFLRLCAQPMMVEVEEEEDDDDDDDVGDEDDESDPGMLPRPKGVTEADWRVYEVVSAATTEFEKKFRAMWA